MLSDLRESGMLRGPSVTFPPCKKFDTRRFRYGFNNVLKNFRFLRMIAAPLDKPPSCIYPPHLWHTTTPPENNPRGLGQGGVYCPTTEFTTWHHSAVVCLLSGAWMLAGTTCGCAVCVPPLSTPARCPVLFQPQILF